MGEPREATAFREKTRVRIGVAGLIWVAGARFIQERTSRALRKHV